MCLPPPKSPRFGIAGSTCTNNVEKLTTSCCWNEPRQTPDGGFEEAEVCQECKIDLSDGSWYDCTPVGNREGGGGGFDPAIPGGGIFQTPSAPLTPDDTVTPNSGGVFNTPQTGGVFSH